MHIRKSFIFAATVTLLLLTAALAYMIGKSSQFVTTSSPQIQLVASMPKATDLQTPMRSPAVPMVKSAEEKPTQKAATAEVGPKKFTVTEQRHIDAWAEAMEMCRGSSDEESQAIWCPRYAKAQTKLNSIGICYGHDDDQSAAEHDIHRCRKGSYRD